MKVIEVLNTVNNKNELADILAVKYPKYYSDKNKTIEALEYFYNEINNTKLDNIKGTEYEDFCIVISEVYDDNTWRDECIFDIAERQRLNGNTKYNIEVTEDGLNKYFVVDGLHINNFINVNILTDYDEYLKSFEDNKDGSRVDNYGIDFIPRSTLLACNVVDLSISKYGNLNCAAELFWEMTFYGLTSEQVKEEADKLDEARKDIENGNVHELKSWDDLKDEVDKNTEEVKAIDSDIKFASEFSKDTNKFCHKLTYNFYKELQNSLK